MTCEHKLIAEELAWKTFEEWQAVNATTPLGPFYKRIICASSGANILFCFGNLLDPLTREQFEKARKFDVVLVMDVGRFRKDFDEVCAIKRAEASKAA